ncbi:MAG: alanine--glyoxylate aminotransferase family protein [Candidatus Omnitrophica bacterium]|nr:alanine--glyoxylate aminotransferase family protein [Candidatus Omnitrophota bacterium]
MTASPPRLLTPGPTPLPPEVLAALGQPIIHHRTPQFQAVLQEVADGLKGVFRTSWPVYLLAGSGTAAMEAAVANLCSRGDDALVLRAGKFGERWGELCAAYGVRVIPLDAPWGRVPSPAQVQQALRDHPSVKGVFATLCETSTGVVEDIRGYAQVVQATPAVLVVDAISGLGAEPLETEAWGVDVVVAGSQKALMLPPGLAFITASPKAWGLIERSTSPRYYLSLPLAKKVWDKEQDTPFTPAITLIVALAAALRVIRQEGLDQILERHRKNAEAIRHAAQAMGLALYAEPSCCSRAVTAVAVPPGVDGKKLVKAMRDQHGITIAGGQSELAGKIFRIASMGHIQPDDIRAAIAALERVLGDLGWTFPTGAGSKALAEVLV